jgi:hypothetical protein
VADAHNLKQLPRGCFGYLPRTPSPKRAHRGPTSVAIWRIVCPWNEMAPAGAVAPQAGAGGCSVKPDSFSPTPPHPTPSKSLCGAKNRGSDGPIRKRLGGAFHCADQLIRGAGRRPAFVLGPCLQLLTPASWAWHVSRRSDVCVGCLVCGRRP